MAELTIRSDELVRKLRDLAHKEQRPVEQVLESMLAQYQGVEADDNDDEPKPGSLAMLAKKAVEANIHSEKPVDTAANSREILNTEYADYLKRRMDEQADSD